MSKKLLRDFLGKVKGSIKEAAQKKIAYLYFKRDKESLELMNDFLVVYQDIYGLVEIEENTYGENITFIHKQKSHSHDPWSRTEAMQ